MKRILSMVLSIVLLAGMVAPAQINSLAEETKTSIIIDNVDIKSDDKNGTWTPGSSRTGKYGKDYLVTLGATGVDTYVIWRPNIVEKGLYSVQFQIPDTQATAVDIANQADYEIVSSNKTEKKVVNQRGQGGKWNPLGQYLFDAGSDGYVKLNAKKYNSNVNTIADAVKFEPVPTSGDKTYAELQNLIQCMPEQKEDYTDKSWEELQTMLETARQIEEGNTSAVSDAWRELLTVWKNLERSEWLLKEIIVDNTDIAIEDMTGTWRPGDTRTGKYGKNYLSSREEGSSITWRPEIKQAGTYHVYYQVPDSEAAATDIASMAEYEIMTEKGMKKRTVDQRGKGGQWNLLGQYQFAEGTEGAVSLSIKETGTANTFADAMRFQLADAVLDDNYFTMTGQWTDVVDAQAYAGSCKKTSDSQAKAELNFTPTGSGYYIVGYKTTETMSDFTKSGRLTIGEASFDIIPENLEAGHDMGAIYLEEGKTYPIQVQLTGEGIGYFDAIELKHSMFTEYYEGFYSPDSIKGWTVSGTTVEEGKLVLDDGEAHTDRNSWVNVSVETEVSIKEIGQSGAFGMVLSGTNNSYLRLIFDQETGKLILKEDYGETGEPIAVSEKTFEIQAGESFAIITEFAFPELIVYVDHEEIMRTNYGRSGNLGFFADNSKINVDYMGVQTSHGKEQKVGNYVINLDDPRQTIWGLGIEIQSDSIGSGNNGLPDSQVRSVPYGINQSERDRLYEDMLKGFRYLRMAGGLYYRGTDGEEKHLQERWDTQNEELAELIEKSGIEGIDFEFWSPTPYFKASGKYTEPKNNSGLKCFSKDFTGDKQAFLEDFADTVVADLRKMDDNGIPVVQFGLQNEAPHNVDTYSHCHYETEEYYQVMKVLVPKLREEFPDIHIQADSWGGQHTAISKRLKQDKEILDEIDGWTFHRIGGNSNSQITEKKYYTSEKGRDDIVVYNNEFEYFNGASDWNSINTAQSLMNWMVFEDSPTWHWLHALKPFGNSEASGFALGFFHPYDFGENETIPKGFEDVAKGEWGYNYKNWNSIRGFLKYMPWNSIRTDVTEDEVRMDQRIMSFQTPEGNQVVALTNRSNADYFTFRIDTGIEGDRWKGYRYTPNDKDEIELGVLSGKTINPQLPPLSIEFWVQDGTREVPERGIRMEKESETVVIGERLPLKASVIPENAPIAGVTWSSSDKGIVTVDKNGTITGVSEGTAVVKATRKDGGFFATCMVTVTNQEDEIYNIITDQTSGAVITASPSDAAKAGDTVTVDVTDIEDGKQLEKLVVTTVKGTEIPIAGVTGDVPEGTWRFAFKMPKEDVYVKAEIGESDLKQLHEWLEDLLFMIEEYISGREDAFTPESLAVLKKAMTEASTVLNDGNAEAKDIKDAYNSLAEAQRKLEKVETEEEDYLIFVATDEVTVTASPSDAVCAGTKVALDISDIPEEKELKEVVVATGSNAQKKIPVKKVVEGLPEDVEVRYTFEMPADDVFVFVTLQDIKNEALDQLKKLIQVAEFYQENSDHYTPESLEVLEEAYLEALAVVDDPDSGETEWKAAHKNLLKAIEQLKKTVHGEDFYLKELKELIEKVHKLHEASYTAETWEKLTECLSIAEDAVKQEPYDADEVREAHAALKAAFNGLEYRSSGDTSGDSSSSSDSDDMAATTSQQSKNWRQDDTGWKFKLPNGDYAKDAWHQVDGVWYRFDTDTYMEMGWLKEDFYDGWFYCDEKGAMKVGWQLIQGKWYYFNTNSDGFKGKMFVNTVTPDGYPVGADGSWQQ